MENIYNTALTQCIEASSYIKYDQYSKHVIKINVALIIMVINRSVEMTTKTETSISLNQHNKQVKFNSVQVSGNGMIVQTKQSVEKVQHKWKIFTSVYHWLYNLV